MRLGWTRSSASSPSNSTSRTKVAQPLHPRLISPSLTLIPRRRPPFLRCCICAHLRAHYARHGPAQSPHRQQNEQGSVRRVRPTLFSRSCSCFAQELPRHLGELHQPSYRSASSAIRRGCGLAPPSPSTVRRAHPRPTHLAHGPPVRINSRLGNRCK